MHKRRVIISAVTGTLALLAVLAVAGIVWYKRTYPYGISHCCITLLSMALRMYAEDHGDRFPAGGASPEASLSLLYKTGGIDAAMLRGMTIPEATARRMLESGKPLTAETCGWHYVPGLTKADDTRLALLWCKQPLGHNGQRTKGGGRQVVFVDGYTRWITGAEWPTFLEEQERLLRQRSPQAKGWGGEPLVRAAIELPDGTRIQAVEGSYTLWEEESQPDSSESGSSSGGRLTVSDLTWYRAPLKDGILTRTLVFSNLMSDPVSVTFAGGVPDRTNVVFKMGPSP
jgi:hypothetical protein